MQPSDPVTSAFRLQEKQKKALKKLRIHTVQDLLYHVPTRYADISTITPLSQVASGDRVTLFGTMEKIEARKTYRSKVPVTKGRFRDIEGTAINITWFHQPYIARMIGDSSMVKITGTISEHGGKPTMVNPEIETTSDLPIDHHHSLFHKGNDDDALAFGLPVYRESTGITSRWFFHAVQKCLGAGMQDLIPDPIPEKIRQNYSLPPLKTALVWVHTPKRAKDAESARKRFAFEEIYLYQKEKQAEKARYQKNFAYPITLNRKRIKSFIDSFPFKPTGAQTQSLETIFTDIEKSHPMTRLLQGDVGSGKTFVAAAAAHSIVTQPPQGQDFGNLQVAYMAPTEVLATQLFESFIEYFAGRNISIGLLTGSECRKFPSKVNPKSWTNISKPQLKKWVANGEIPILIGTHALIYKTVQFPHLALAIIDEEHRFGTKQRQSLAQKDNKAPHVLSMSATPIPRTLALTIYGDLDISVLDEYPPGRKPVLTELVHPEKREEVYQHIRQELENGRQAYVICPRIDEPDPDEEGKKGQRSVASEIKKLGKSVFPDYTVAGMHSRMDKDKKQSVMADFYDHKIDILVSTSVVEVGVNVPNATMIIIEGAERFGLSQLHQLRGRVLRGNHQAHCYLFTDSSAEKTRERLTALAGTASGFDLAEIDLSLRGSGDLAGIKQSGMSDLAMEALQNPRLVEAAREAAAAGTQRIPSV